MYKAMKPELETNSNADVYEWMDVCDWLQDHSKTPEVKYSDEGWKFTDGAFRRLKNNK